MARCHELLRGAIGTSHTHSAPSFFDRLLDDVGLAEQARAAGLRAVLYGQLHSPAPAEGLRIFVQLCLEQGISETDIRTMVADNPARLLGLD
jgi:uncharacterized protein DUF6282